MSAKRKLMITIDVEAQPARAERDHIDRLIWGKFGAEQSGMAELMASAERRGVRLVTYFDYAEQYLYGDSMLEVAREIHRRGHDLQLHLHPEFLGQDFFRKHGLPTGANLNDTSPEAANVFADFLCASQREITGETPRGFRGGGYRFSGEMLKALHERGVRADSSYNPSRATQPVHVGYVKQFCWEGGLFELPVSNVFAYSNPTSHLDYNFNAQALWGKSPADSAQRHRRYLDDFYAAFGQDAIAVLVLHSWSLLRRDDKGHYQYIGREAIERFEALLASLAGYADVIDTEAAVALMEGGALGPAQDLALAERTRRSLSPKPSSPPPGPANAPSPAVGTDSSAGCSVCGTPVQAFEDFNGPKRRCPSCGSVERQRAFADLCRGTLAGRLSLPGQKILLIAPSSSERRLLRELGVADVTTSDIRPEVKPDLIADVCDMSQVPNDSFDVIVASYVLTCVHSLDRALSELTRVLRPGGMLLTSDPIARGRATQEHVDEKVITNWYGKEAFDKYRIGSFRSFGDLDAEKLVGRYLSCEAFSSRDVANGSEVVWLVSRKAGGSAAAEVKKPSTNPAKVDSRHLRLSRCPICGDSLETFDADQNCKGCTSRARLRSLVPLLGEVIAELGPRGGARGLPLLGFAVTIAEGKLLDELFPARKSVSLFGKYASVHEEGVDARDLSRYSADAFCGVYASLLFDYFEEHERALAECFRVVAPGGLLFTHIAPYRLQEGTAPPRQTSAIKSRAGYFDYLPSGKDLPDVKVGREWFLDALRRAGFEPHLVKVEDPIPGMVCEWFVGVKPLRLPAPRPRAAESTSPLTSQRWFAASRELFRAPVAFSLDGGEESSLVIEELSIPGGPSLAFMEDTHRQGSRYPREILVTDSQRTQVFSSNDGGQSFRRRYEKLSPPSGIRQSFTLADGRRILKLHASPVTYVLDAEDRLVDVSETGIWNWHGSQGIGQAPNGTVMFAEYAALAKGEAVPPLSVWRLKSHEGARWARVLSLPAAYQPPDGAIRHFHLCSPNPARPEQWLLAAGDKGHHNRLWISDDDGDTWQDVVVDGLKLEDVAPAHLSGALRLTQLSATESGELIWGSDDRMNIGRAPLMAMRLAGSRGSARHLGWAGPNAVRNVIRVAPDVFLFLCEAKHRWVESSECVLLDLKRGKRTTLTLPNVSGVNSPVTDSLGSAELKDGAAFFPALGSVLTTSRAGIFRLGLQSSPASRSLAPPPAVVPGLPPAPSAASGDTTGRPAVGGVLVRPHYRCDPRGDHGIDAPTRFCFWDTPAQKYVHLPELAAGQVLDVALERITQSFDLKVKVQIRRGVDWVDKVPLDRVNVDSESRRGIRYRYFPREGSRHLLVVLQAMNTTPGYNYVGTLAGTECSRLYIKDDYGEDPGTRSSYYLGARRSFDVSDGVRSLIREALVDLGLRPKQLIFGGSSKGAYAALFHGYGLHAGYVIAGGPQVLLGNFLNSSSPGSMHPPILRYLAGDHSNESVAWANNVLFEQIAAAGPPYPKLILHVGEHEPHYREHVRPLLDFLSARSLPAPELLDLGAYTTHAELDRHFPAFFRAQVDAIVQSSGV